MSADPRSAAPPAGIEGCTLEGPFPVGRYAEALKQYLGGRARVQVHGEVCGFKVSRTKVFFELRDARGAVPVSMWRDRFEELRVPVADGALVVVAGGPDYYPGSQTASPSFSFLAFNVSLAGEGVLLAEIERRRRALREEGLLPLQGRLTRRVLPRRIGVVAGAGGKAREDFVAALARRGWHGTVVDAPAPVQDRRAAPLITRAIQDLIAYGEVELVVVARGGGSVTDLLAFSDETLCRVVALAPVPVIASIGHHTDRTLLDDVAAASCSTPTHAAEAAVPLDCGEARRSLVRASERLAHHVTARPARERDRLGREATRLGAALGAHRARLHQQVRELRAAGRRRLGAEGDSVGMQALVLDRKTAAAAGAGLLRARRELDAAARTLDLHDPELVLRRGYAIAEDGDGTAVTDAATARAADRLTLRFAGQERVPVRVEDE